MIDDCPSYGVNVLEQGVRGDGAADDGPAIQRLLGGGHPLLYFPAGAYSIGTTLRLPSHTRMVAHRLARFRLADGAGRDVNSFLLCNADPDRGNENIWVQGGMWDGNTPGNPRHEETDRHGYTGVMINFRHVRGLTLLDMRQKNSSAYHTRLSGVRDFRIERIRFEDTIEAANQDGVHVAGQCEDGLIRDISAVGECSTGDDLIALNADDALDRSETRGKLGGPIRRIRIEGVRAEDCHTFVRLASVWSEIADIEIHDVRGGCRVNVINADALRHCLSPLFRKDDPRYAGGAGLLRRIRVRDCAVYKSGGGDTALLRLDERMEDFEVERFTRLTDRDGALRAPTIRLGYITTDSITLEGISRADVEACEAASTCTKFAAAPLPHAPGTPARYRVEAGVDAQGSFISGCSSFERLRVDQSQCDRLPDPDWTVAKGQYVV